jgi:hypothetical protein
MHIFATVAVVIQQGILVLTLSDGLILPFPEYQLDAPTQQPFLVCHLDQRNGGNRRGPLLEGLSCHAYGCALRTMVTGHEPQAQLSYGMPPFISACWFEDPCGARYANLPPEIQACDEPRG